MIKKSNQLNIAFKIETLMRITIHLIITKPTQNNNIARINTVINPLDFVRKNNDPLNNINNK